MYRLALTLLLYALLVGCGGGEEDTFIDRRKPNCGSSQCVQQVLDEAEPKS